MTTTFLEILFPSEISYQSTGGPKFKTTIFTSDSGYEQRNVDWSMVRCEFDASHGIKNQDQMDALTAFFMAVNGRAYGFRYKDWNDFEIAMQNIGTGDGSTKSFQFIKKYSFAQTESSVTATYTRTLTKIVWSSLSGITVNGVTITTSPGVGGQKYTMDYNTGIITFQNAPAMSDAIVVGAAEFHVPCRFDTDFLNVTQEFWNTASWNSIAIVEVRDWGAVF